jgi:trk system potassium uptake protein TrkA
MRVTVVGAGDVGTGITQRLADSHEVCVVDVDEDRLDALASAHDVRVVAGDGRSLDVLEEAGVEEADILVASTDRDGANVMICGAAKNTINARTVARVKRIDLYKFWQDAEGAFGIDDMLCVNRLAARNVVRSATLPSAIAVDTFVDGQVETAEFAVDADAPIAGGTIAEADRFASLTFAGILRDEDVIVPDLPVPAVPVLPTPDAPKPGDVTQRPGTGPREPR